MAGSTRIKGKQLSLKIGTNEFFADTTACTIENEEADSDVVTFADAAAGGGRKYLLKITGIQSTDEDSLWSYIWDNSGTDVAFTYAPHANATASTDQPHFVGTVTVGPKPTIGGEAGTDSTFTFETEWEIVGEPTIDRGN
ncbi:hypothetical protein SAMN06309944_0165 [Micrococcales bacterium KH10]|nr:hypothetical protein SAMN06309944_0165 [Micrococcales bacterium KH10]